MEIRVVPNSSRNEVVEGKDGTRVYVKAPPDKGKANKAVLKLLSERFGTKKVRIISGEKSRRKTVEIYKE